MNTKEIMLKVRSLVDHSELSHLEIGLRMGYPPTSARQSLEQFMRSANPTVGVLGRFAEAMGIGLVEFFQEEKDA